MEVLRVARELAEADSATSWLSKHLVYRSLGKPVLMVAIYGGSYRTYRQDIIEALRKEKLYPNPVSYEDTKVLTSLLRKASRVAFPAVFEKLAWVEELAQTALEQGATAHSWKTPNGDRIQHVKYQAAEAIRVETHFLGKVSIGLGNLKTPNTKKLKSGLSPHFVHSYDASILKAAFHDWQKPLSTIHDCIADLPIKEEAHKRIREAFVRFCDGDPLAELADELKINHLTMERLPRGDSDLLLTLDSKYIFNLF